MGDNNMIAVISYIAHQASVSSFPRSKTGLEVAQDLMDMFYKQPVSEWAEVLDKADLPHDYFVTFAALTATVFSLIMKYEYCVASISFLSKLIIPKEDADFIIFHYLPHLGLATKDINLTSEEKTDLIKKGGGMLIKILYAFVWQEYFIPLDFLYTSIPLHIGAFATPYI